MNLILNRLLSHTNGQRAVFAAALCALTSMFLIYSVSVTRSLVITGTAWISVFSFFSLFSAIISFLSANITNKWLVLFILFNFNVLIYIKRFFFNFY